MSLLKKIFFIVIATLPTYLLANSNASIIIKNATIVTMSDKGIIKNGAIVIMDDKIIDIGNNNIANKYQAIRIIDAKNNIVMPGMINAHTHIPMVAFRGLGENGISNRLFGYFIPLEKKFVTPEMVYTSTIHGGIEMIQGGVTTFADMYYYMDEEARAINKLGLRGVLGETIINGQSPDSKNEASAIQKSLDFAMKHKNDDMVIPAFAPHTLYTVSQSSLEEIAKLSKEYNIRVLTHLAEMPAKENKDKSSKDNVHFLEKVGLLNNRTTVAHAIHINKKDLQKLKDSDVGVAYNPEANAKGATGIADAYYMLKIGVAVGIGTDGPMSANQLSILPYLNYAANMQRLKYSDRTIMLPKDIVYMATLGGAKALHIDNYVGSLEKGKKADLIIIDTKSPNITPIHDIYAAIVYQANTENVLTSIINGKVVMLNRELLTYSLPNDAKDFGNLTDKVYKYGKELAKKAK